MSNGLRLFWAALLAFALIAAGCSSDDDDSASDDSTTSSSEDSGQSGGSDPEDDVIEAIRCETEAESETGEEADEDAEDSLRSVDPQPVVFAQTAPDTSDTTVPLTPTVPDAGEEGGFHDADHDFSLIAPDLIVIPREDAGVADISGAAFEIVTERDDLQLFIEERYPDVNYDLGGDGLLDRVLASVSFIRIDSPPDDFDVRVAIEELRSAGIDARPLFAFRFEGHFTRSPGVDPLVLKQLSGTNESRDAIKTEMESASDANTFVGVVDSGFVEQAASFVSFPSGLYESNSGDDPCWASHGTFVASVIKQIAPEAKIYGRAAAPLADDVLNHFKLENNDPVGFWTRYHGMTDELAVVIALDELMKTQPEISILNLSFGTYGTRTKNPLDSYFGCRESGEGPVAAPIPDLIPPGLVEATLRCIKKDTDGVEIFAAGGNQQINSPFYPAAFDDAIGVGATAEDGEDGTNLIVWNEDGKSVPVVQSASSYWWMDKFEYGCNLMGIGTDPAAEAVVWSGSSFATAVASAKAAGATVLPQTLVTMPEGIRLSKCTNEDDNN